MSTAIPAQTPYHRTTYWLCDQTGVFEAYSRR
jgi:hypothetical protein